MWLSFQITQSQGTYYIKPTQSEYYALKHPNIGMTHTHINKQTQVNTSTQMHRNIIFFPSLDTQANYKHLNTNTNTQAITHSTNTKHLHTIINTQLTKKHLHMTQQHTKHANTITHKQQSRATSFTISSPQMTTIVIRRACMPSR